MGKHVKGALFLDYVRMVKKRKDVNWGQYLTPEDNKILEQLILPSAWYPLETYQRLGAAVLHEIAKGKVELVRQWGRISMEELTKVYANLVCAGNPLRSLEIFQLLRTRFFDSEVLEVTPVGDNGARIKVDATFAGEAEEAYAYQMLGSFERLLELSGAKNIKYRFSQASRKGDPNTVIEIKWE